MNEEIQKIIDKEKEISNSVATGEMKLEIVKNCLIFARQTSQTIGEKNDYYITIEQLEDLIKNL